MLSSAVHILHCCDALSVVGCRQGALGGREQTTALRAGVSTLPGRQGGDAVPAVSSPGRLPALRRLHARLRQVPTENTRHRPHLSALASDVCRQSSDSCNESSLLEYTSAAESKSESPTRVRTIFSGLEYRLPQSAWSSQIVVDVR